MPSDSNTIGVWNTQCVLYPISGYTPKSAIFVNAIIISVSTAVGQISKDKYDPDGSKDASAFFVYLCVVWATAFLVHTMMLFLFNYGGGMLADRENPIQATPSFWWSGKPKEQSEINRIGPHRLFMGNTKVETPQGDSEMDSFL